jgi:hypothetical protein
VEGVDGREGLSVVGAVEPSSDGEENGGSYGVGGCAGVVELFGESSICDA